MSSRVGLIGAGLMGRQIAARLINQGCEVVGYDIDERSLDMLREIGGTSRRTIGEVTNAVDVVILSLPHGRASNEVSVGDGGITETANPDQSLIVLDTTTTRPAEARAIGEHLSSRGIGFMDVGISGSGPMISRGEGLVLAGGPQELWSACKPLLFSLNPKARYVGALGMGMTTKLIVNHVLYVNRLALAEGILLAERLGASGHEMLEVLRNSAAASGAMEIWGTRMVDRQFDDPTSRVRQHRKDVSHIEELATEANLSLPALRQIVLVADEALRLGYADADNSSVIEAVRSLAASDAVHSQPINVKESR